MEHFEQQNPAPHDAIEKKQKTAESVIRLDLRCFFTSERAGIRTPDNLIKSQVLYRLSYTPETGLVGFEPTNAGVKVLCLTAWR